MTDRQSKIDSFMEAFCSTVVGFFVSLLTWAIVAPLMGIPLVLSESLIITAIFTVVSVLRSYILRRVFNGRSVWSSLRSWHEYRRLSVWDKMDRKLSA